MNEVKCILRNNQDTKQDICVTITQRRMVQFHTIKLDENMWQSTQLKGINGLEGSKEEYTFRSNDMKFV